uniref:Uncharacterized protein n=1 Tax=Anguilla anguilla TaxID=7936 RepID=A0A0E9QT97_ANGAN
MHIVGRVALRCIQLECYVHTGLVVHL